MGKGKNRIAKKGKGKKKGKNRKAKKGKGKKKGKNRKAKNKKGKKGKNRKAKNKKGKKGKSRKAKTRSEEDYDDGEAGGTPHVYDKREQTGNGFARWSRNNYGFGKK